MDDDDNLFLKNGITDLRILKKARFDHSSEKPQEPLDIEDDEESDDLFDIHENEEIQKLLKLQNEKLETLGLSKHGGSTWDYISYKAASFLIEGAEKYRKADYYSYPLEEWNEEKLKMGCEQIIYNCAGIKSDKTHFENLSEIDIRNLFEMFHFRKYGDVENRGNNIMEMPFRHKIDKRRHFVLLKIDKNNKYKNDFYYNFTVKNENVKLCEMENGIIKIFTDNPSLGVSVEHEYINTFYILYKIKEQSLQKMEINNEIKQVDVFKIEFKLFTLKGKEIKKFTHDKKIIFDISSFYK